MLRTRDYYNPSDDRLRLIHRLQVLRPLLAAMMLASAMIGVFNNLLGQTIDWPGTLSRAFTHPSTALCLSLLAVAIYLTPAVGPPARIVPYLTVSSGGLALFYFIEGRLGLDPLRSILPVHGRMGVDTSIAIMLLSLALGLRLKAAVPGLLCLAAFLAILLNCIIGLTFGVTYFAGEMGALTLVSLCFAAFCAISIYTDHAIVGVVLLASGVGTRTRVMVVVGSLVPWASGMFLYRYWGMPDDIFEIEAVMISVIIMSTIVAAIMSGYQHQIADDLRSRAEQRLAEQAVTDGLTKLRNRAGLTEVLRRRMAELRRTKKPVGLVLFDLDHFKAINDTHGHDEGDRVLVNVGRALEPLLRQGDVLGRWGGEEFLLVADMRNADELEQLVERLRIAVYDISRQTGVHCKTGGYIVSASFGVSYMRAEDASFDEAVKRADLALYEAKSGGRNRVIFAKEDRRAA